MIRFDLMKMNIETIQFQLQQFQDVIHRKLALNVKF